jgi:hypothetical protein
VSSAVTRLPSRNIAIAIRGVVCALLRRVSLWLLCDGDTLLASFWLIAHVFFNAGQPRPSFVSVTQGLHVRACVVCVFDALLFVSQGGRPVLEQLQWNRP